MEAYDFRFLNLWRRSVEALPPMSLDTHTQYIADHSRNNCVVLNPAFYSPDEPTVPYANTTRLEAAELCILAGWVSRKTETLLQTKYNYVHRNSAGENSMQWLSLLEIDKRENIRVFKNLAALLDHEANLDTDSMRPAFRVSGIELPIPISAALGAYSLVMIDKGLGCVADNLEGCLNYFQEAACALIEATRHRIGDHFISESKLIPGARSRQKKGAVTKKLLRYNQTAWRKWDEQKPKSYNHAYSLVCDDLENLSHRIIEEGSTRDQTTPPSKNTVVKWYKRSMRG